MHMKLKKDNRIELRFALIGPGTMWNLLYEGMDQILKKKNDYDITIKDDGIEINNFIGINDFENGEKWTNLMNKLKDEIIKMI